MACSRSPWARYRKPRQAWAANGAYTRPSRVARRSASSPGAGPQRRRRGRSRSAPATPGTDPLVCPGRARLAVRSLHVAPQQLGRPAEVADSIVYLPQVMGCFRLQGSIGELGREREGLLARRNGAVEVSRDSETAAIWASTRPSWARSSRARARASASPNRARDRLYSPNTISVPPNARRSSRASPRVSTGSGRCARAWRASRRLRPRGMRRGRGPWRRPAGSRSRPCPIPHPGRDVMARRSTWSSSRSPARASSASTRRACSAFRRRSCSRYLRAFAFARL